MWDTPHTHLKPCHTFVPVYTTASIVNDPGLVSRNTKAVQMGMTGRNLGVLFFNLPLFWDKHAALLPKSPKLNQIIQRRFMCQEILKSLLTGGTLQLKSTSHLNFTHLNYLTLSNYVQLISFHAFYEGFHKKMYIPFIIHFRLGFS